MFYINKIKITLNKRLYYDVKTIIKEGKEINIYNIKPFFKELSARYINRIFEFNRNNKRALGALKSIILNDNNRFKDKTSFKDLYDNIVKTFN
jgi:ADP-dependent phosphofructokinase/glucokinase